MGILLLPAPRRALAYLIDGADHIEGGEGTQKQSAVAHHFGLTVEDCHQPRCDPDHQQAETGRQQGRDLPCGSGSLLRPFQLTPAQVLTHKGSGCKAQGLHGQQNDLVDLGVGGPARHAVGAKVVDIGLDKDVGEVGDGHLDCRRHAHPENSPEHFGLHLHLGQVQAQAGGGAEKDDKDQQRRAPLREDGGVGHAPDSHFKDDDQQQVQRDI